MTANSPTVLSRTRNFLSTKLAQPKTSIFSAPRSPLRIDDACLFIDRWNRVLAQQVCLPKLRFLRPIRIDTKSKVFLEMGLTDHKFVIGFLLVRLRIAPLIKNEWNHDSFRFTKDILMIDEERESRILGTAKLVRLITFSINSCASRMAREVMATNNQHNYQTAFNGEPALLETSAVTTDSLTR